ncbi:hypothetical protein [Neobacillus sp. PS2-9]|uniref:hypothetical protein n=1 Tax=Neobacillus sp. PS2-9 TaxID=3070676 RepID=UPI0027E0815F|nr:hypothetical protein [Neobacillus sp. PS2-9]WML58552.1 hypothetical protein RCG25_01805 [Neobacillus sp. PS2-9]
MRKKQKTITPQQIEVTRVSIAVPTKLKQAFRKSTFLNDTSMNDAIVKFIEDYVKENPVPEIRHRGLRKPTTRKKAGAVNE